MAGGISPYKTLTIPLGEYNPDHYLMLLYHAMQNRGWDIGYFDHDGIIAYTPISWPSYAEEVSVRIKGNDVVIKSECVGYQGLFTDYGKNSKNLELLMIEVEYVEFHLKDELEQNTQQLMNTVPDKQFLSLTDPPMAGKELLHSFFNFLIPQNKYFVTPILVILNTLVFFFTLFFIGISYAIYRSGHYGYAGDNITEHLFLLIGSSERSQVLNGQLWRLVTNTFLHFSLRHLLGNMIVLVYIGSLIESKLGKWNYLFLYLCTGIIASMVSVMWRDHGISAGASGAIFGLFGILLALLSTDFYERSARRALLISTAIFVAYSIIPVGHGIDHAAHFGGLVSGYVFGWIAYFGLKNKNRLMQQWGIILSSTVVVIIFVSLSLLFTPRYQLKEYEALKEQSRVLATDVNHCFYSDDAELNPQEKLYNIEHNALPKIKQMNKVSDKLNSLVLPSARKRDARFRAKILKLESHFFNLLYLEFKTHDQTKYRPDIIKDTEKINELRVQWGNEVN